jgi:Tfp pilus assembly protein FimT
MRKGFTLVEMTLYVGLTSVVMIALLRAMTTMLEHNSLTSSRESVQKELRLTIDTMIHTIRESLSVQSAASVFDNSAGHLVLSVSGSARHPTEFRLYNSAIQVKKGSGSWSNLTSSGVIVNQLLFEQKTDASTSATIGITVTGTDRYAVGSPFSTKSITIRDTGTVRKQFGVGDPRMLFGDDYYAGSEPNLLFGIPLGQVELCANSIDDDSDALVDCADIVDCVTGVSCGVHGLECNSGNCICPGGQVNESTCNDASDNDCDGSIDCADTVDCPNGTTCDTGKICDSGSCVVADVTPPTISVLSPVNNDFDVSITTNLVMTFSEAVDPEAGMDNDIAIYDAMSFTLVESIDAQDAKVTGGGGTVITVNPTITLDTSTEYYVLIGADAFDDAAGNSFAGITNPISWSFTTEEEE